jgi:hypothetical protein
MDIEYKEKVLDKILTELGGKKVALMERQAEHDLSLLWMIKLPFKATNFLLGTYVDNFATYGTPDYITGITEKMVEVKKPFMGKSLVDDGGDSFMGGMASIGGMSIAGWELFAFYDSHDRDSVQGINDALDKVAQYCEENKVASSHARTWRLMFLSKEERKKLLSKPADVKFYRWQTKVKKALDPNDVGDLSYKYLED